MANQAVSIPPINPLYRLPIVEQASGQKRSTIYRKIRQGLFPKPVAISTDKNGETCQVAWPANEIQAIIDARIAGKTNDEIKQLVAELEAARSSK